MMPFMANGQTLTQEQRIVAMTILGEARGEGYNGMYAVALVIKQRSTAWGKTPTQVCLQRKHFACWNKSDPNRKKLPHLLNTPEGHWAKQMAIHLTKLNSDFVKNADHYCTLKAYKANKVYWAKGKKPVAIVGNHVFFKLR